MRRGRGQVLYRFLPEQIVDYSDTKSISRVSYWRCTELGGLNKHRLIEAIESRKRSRFEGRTYGYPRLAEDYIILEPIAIEVDLFPLTFICQTCGSARRFNSVSALRSEISKHNYKCPRCKTGFLEQHDFVHYHSCGEIESLVVRPCPQHGLSWIVLNKNYSDYPKNWWWQCKACDQASPRNVARIGAHCNSCTGTPRMSHAPFRKGDVFYPHTLSMINISSLEELVLSNLDWELAIAEYLGVLPRGRTRELLLGRTQVTKKAELVKKKQKLIAQGLPPDVIEKVLSEFGLSDTDAEISEAIGRLEDLLRLPQEEYSPLSQELMGYVESLHLETTRSLNAVVDSIEGPAKERMKQSPAKLRALGFSDAWLAVDLPVVSVAFGYSRGDPTMESAILRAFPRNKDFASKTPIYGLRVETEAVIMELDRSRVLSWLSANGWVSNSLGTLDAGEARAWFLKNVHLRNIPQYEATPATDRVTWAVCNLLHSLSHLFLAKASGLVGLDKGSMREILFPNIPAFCLFASNSQGYQLGGIVSLFENSMNYWLDRAKDDVHHCLYDPVCADSDGACHACLYIPEISCERFNRDLSRAFIIGRNDDRRIIGFWE